MRQRAGFRSGQAEKLHFSALAARRQDQEVVPGPCKIRDLCLVPAAAQQPVFSGLPLRQGKTLPSRNVERFGTGVIALGNTIGFSVQLKSSAPSRDGS
ncbi:MAG: hypothetical protein HC794_06960 [Nitrospiraceae bacterium]|nr:hypothetical protein [Nitrospiraceae bacterium]